MTKGEGKAVLIVLTNIKELEAHRGCYENDQGRMTANGVNVDMENTSRRIRTGFDIKEMAFIYQSLHKQHGFELNLASVEGGSCQIDPASLKASEHEEEVQSFLADQCAMQWIKCSDKLGAFDLQRFQAIIFIGGPGAMFDFPRGREPIQQVVKYIWEDKKGVVAAIGHGVAALIRIKGEDGGPFIKNKQVTANTREEDREMKLERDFPFNLEDELSKSGARFRKAEAFSRNVVIDGRLITGQNRNSTRDWVKQIVQHLQK